MGHIEIKIQWVCKFKVEPKDIFVREKDQQLKEEAGTPEDSA